ITGMGVGLLGGPVLSIFLGPVQGVTMVNGLSIINAVNNAWAVRKRTDWKRFRIISAALILGSLPAVAVIHFLDGPVLLIAIGVFVLLGLGISLFPAEKFKIPVEAKGPLVAFGMAAGFMSTIAGIAGPSLTIYARLTNWDYREFVATLHPVLVVANTVSFLLKLVCWAASISAVHHCGCGLLPLQCCSLVLGLAIKSMPKFPPLWRGSWQHSSRLPAQSRS